VSRFALFGGAFDPPHRTHERILRAALAQLPIDRVIVVPAGRHPHKDGAIHAPADDRLAMCRAAFAGIAGAVLSEYELRRPGSSYTIDTLAHFVALHPGSRPFLLLGSDNVATLPTWHRGAELIALAELAIYPRAGAPITPAALRAIASGGARVLGVEPDPRSSRELRARLRSGDACAGDLHPAVRALIAARGLYRA
jgi:nicotinate-nucleotide adenylyltransferase